MKETSYIDLPLAIETLARRRAVGKVLRLNEVRLHPTLASQADYQRAYKGYYRLGRRSRLFYDAYFSMLEREAGSKTLPKLHKLLEELFDATGERHLSFCTKLIATISPSAVIYDRNVARLLGVKYGPLPNKEWVAEAIRRYDTILATITAVTMRHDWLACEKAFDEAFPHGAKLSQVRKADLMIWASYSK